MKTFERRKIKKSCNEEKGISEENVVNIDENGLKR